MKDIFIRESKVQRELLTPVVIGANHDPVVQSNRFIESLSSRISNMQDDVAQVCRVRSVRAQTSDEVSESDVLSQKEVLSLGVLMGRKRSRTVGYMRLKLRNGAIDLTIETYALRWNPKQPIFSVFEITLELLDSATFGLSTQALALVFWWL